MTEKRSSGEGSQKPSDEEPQKRGRWKLRFKEVLQRIEAAVPGPAGLTFTGIGIVGVVLVLLVWLMLRQSPVTVPNLVGMPRAAAETQLKDAGLNLRLIYEEISDRPMGTVLRTDPAVGTELARGTGVSFVLASSPSIPLPPVPLPSPEVHLNLQPYPYPYPQLYPQPYPYPPQQLQQPPQQPQQPPPPPPPPPSPPSQVTLGLGRVDHPDRKYHDCATGYRFNFSQQVSMTQPGRVTYRWVLSDQTSSPVEYVDFLNPGTQVVTTWWKKLGNPGGKLTGWAQIEILTPQAGFKGERINFSHTCPPSPSPSPSPPPSPSPTSPSPPPCRSSCPSPSGENRAGGDGAIRP